MHLLLTRPTDEAEESAARLRAMGHTVTLAPMLEIFENADASIDLEGVGAVVVTSPRAVQALNARVDFPRLAALPLFTVGDRTAQTASASGFSFVESAGGDVVTLSALVGARHDRAQGTLLYACGRDRRGDLEGRLRDAGFAVRAVEVYRAEAVRDLPEPARLALADGRIDGVLVYSARTAGIFLDAMTRAGLISALRRLTVFAISRAAAERLGAAGALRVEVAARPEEASLLDLVAMPR